MPSVIIVDHYKSVDLSSIALPESTYRANSKKLYLNATTRLRRQKSEEMLSLYMIRPFKMRAISLLWASYYNPSVFIRRAFHFF